MRRFMDRVLRDQVLFATDWPVFPHRRALDEWHDLGLREETLDALLGGNVERLLLAKASVAERMNAPQLPAHQRLRRALGRAPAATVRR